MQKTIRLLRYDWPLHFVLLLVNWLPDNVFFLRLRGSLVKPFFGKCGRNLRLGRNLTFYNPSKISIGDDVYIAYGSWFSSGAKINIDNEVTIGPYCVLASSDHQRGQSSYFSTGAIDGPIVIGKGCWLGAHSVITAGCKIDSGSVLGAGAVCTENIPQNVLAVGVPAKVIKQFESQS